MSGKSRPHTVSTRRPSQAPRTHAADRADVRRAASAPPESATRDNVTNGVRLNKAIAAAGLCSRRKADELILAGQVRINGTLEENPARRVLPGDRIAVNDRELAAVQEYYYLLLHKPVQTVCTVNDPEGRPTVMAYLPPEVRHLRLYPVGRLDYFSEGLLLLTNDGELAQRLTHPRHHQPKTYEVLIRGSVPETALAVMRRGMRLDEGQALLPVDVEAKTAENGNTLLRMVLRQGVNRQIRRMCRDLGLTILRLRRVAQGPLALGSLKPGAARALAPGEVAGLRQSVGLPSQV
ncbi:pseudouridine synthase [uncultured Desulfovibrio sp.]|uniref:pseudouridine synthase n=1 Tax=uncultured Desulfovibrio sp. TaxID=167968 RepID=UPI0026DCE2F8|nr:pseudouridine synthase [uncultured Desulfovibrio sp.]